MAIYDLLLIYVGYLTILWAFGQSYEVNNTGHACSDIGIDKTTQLCDVKVDEVKCALEKILKLKSCDVVISLNCEVLEICAVEKPPQLSHEKFINKNFTCEIDSGNIWALCRHENTTYNLTCSFSIFHCTKGDFCESQDFFGTLQDGCECGGTRRWDNGVIYYLNANHFLNTTGPWSRRIQEIHRSNLRLCKFGEPLALIGVITSLLLLALCAYFLFEMKKRIYKRTRINIPRFYEIRQGIQPNRGSVSLQGGVEGEEIDVLGEEYQMCSEASRAPSQTLRKEDAQRNREKPQNQSTQEISFNNELYLTPVVADNTAFLENPNYVGGVGQPINETRATVVQYIQKD